LENVLQEPDQSSSTNKQKVKTENTVIYNLLTVRGLDRKLKNELCDVQNVWLPSHLVKIAKLAAVRVGLQSLFPGAK
jgi:hypothetical protein